MRDHQTSRASRNLQMDGYGADNVACQHMKLSKYYWLDGPQMMQNYICWGRLGGGIGKGEIKYSRCADDGDEVWPVKLPVRV